MISCLLNKNTKLHYNRKFKENLSLEIDFVNIAVLGIDIIYETNICYN